MRQMLPDSVRVISGPGCPVCVTPAGYIDAAAEIALKNDAQLLTFGDLVKVPGIRTSLEKARAEGAEVRTVISPLEALKAARENPERKHVFLAVGFETTAPATALAVRHADEEKLANLTFLPAHKLVPPALEHLVRNNCKVDAFIYPGHVSAITGMAPYRKLAEQDVSGVVAGFEAEDLIRAIFAIIQACDRGETFCLNLYPKVVSEEGNLIAQKLMKDVFEEEDAAWRGIGSLPASGLRLRPPYERFDAWKAYDIVMDAREQEGCLCGLVLTGRMEPQDCPLFGKICRPENPSGACMVSSEGSCAAAYRYSMGETT
ncbi:MAG: hydrogenase formation protein HypD [Bacillota bacterium]|nr:hydrogenase formation protein HypD [Bacillota bacterium]